MLTGGSAISCVFCQHGESAILGLVVVVISSSDNRAWTLMAGFKLAVTG